MLNPRLFTFQSILTIGLIATVWHIVAKSIYMRIDGMGGEASDDNS